VGSGLHPDQCANCGGFPLRGFHEWRATHPSSQRTLCKGRMACRYHAADLRPSSPASVAKEFRQRVYSTVLGRLREYVQYSQLNRETAHNLRAIITSVVREHASEAGYSYETADVATEMILGQTVLDTSRGQILFTDLEEGRG
jgi:hypothetical protein